MQGQDNDKTLLGGFTLNLSYYINCNDGHKHKIQSDTIVGRGQECDIVIEDKKISRKHAVLKISDGRLEITDLGSSNGTFVNGKKITELTKLANGDLISFEKHLFTTIIEMNDNAEKVTVDPIDEVEDDHTSVMDLTEAQLLKLKKPPNKLKIPKVEVPKVEVPNKPIKNIESNSSIPSSWIEEENSVDGTKMMDASQLQALKAGVAASSMEPKVSSGHDSNTTRLHSFIEGQGENVIELPIKEMSQASGWEIGRDNKCDIVLDHPSISSRHAQLIHQNGRWKIVNLVSTNGIVVNDKRRLSAYLGDGDKIGLGSVNLIFKTPNKIKQKGISTSNQGASLNSKIVPVLFALILIAIAVAIYLYLNK